MLQEKIDDLEKEKEKFKLKIQEERRSFEIKIREEFGKQVEQKQSELDKLTKESNKLAKQLDLKQLELDKVSKELSKHKELI